MKFCRLIGFICLLAGLMSLPVQAGSGSFAATAGLIDGGQAQFLPVEQAYPLDVSAAADGAVLEWAIMPGYFLYRERLQVTAEAAGKPLSLALQTSAGEMKYDDLFERETEIWHNTARVTLHVSPLPTGPWQLTVESQGCADAGLCYPPQTQRFTVDSAAQTVAVLSTSRATSEVAATESVEAVPVTEGAGPVGLLHALVWALLGGLILNLMPCVFPVLSLKVFAMAAQRERDDEAHLHSWVYAAGVVLSFVLVAGIMLALRAGGEAVGWGFQLQEPLFISLLVYLFFVLGLSFSGIVHIGGSLMGLGQQLVSGNPVKSAFFTGVLAVVVASPCSVPFMGVALGYAVTQSAPMALMVFATLGLGMALPFIALAYWPQMLHRLPAPGPWMERLRQFLAFPLYATALWLLWVLGQQGGQMAMVWLLAGLILLVMAGWLWRDAAAARWEKLLAVLMLIAALILPPMLAVEACKTSPVTVQIQTGDVEAYSAERLAQLRAEGKPVFINLTAAWCINCLVNEKVALSRAAVTQRLHEKGITYLKGDWTNRDPAITALLQQFGRSGVPLYLYFPPGVGGEIVILPQLLTESAVLDVLL